GNGEVPPRPRRPRRRRLLGHPHPPCPSGDADPAGRAHRRRCGRRAAAFDLRLRGQRPDPSRGGDRAAGRGAGPGAHALGHRPRPAEQGRHRRARGHEAPGPLRQRPLRARDPPGRGVPAAATMPPVAGTVAADVFAEAISQVTVAASKDDTLPLLTGVKVEISGETMTLMATDRYRLALRELTWNPSSPGAELTALVRGRTLHEVARSLATGGGVEIALSEDAGATLIGF